MHVMTSSEEIGVHNYTHWTDRPVSPGDHSHIAYVPQSILDGWEAYCSCGQWRAFVSFYEYNSREAIKAALDGAFEQHKALTA